MIKRFSKTLQILLLAAVFFSIPTTRAISYMVKFKEDWYRLYHVHYQQYPDDCIENIYWLEKALQADFANPLYARIKISNEKEWEKYRYLFQMHINLKLIEQHLRLGRTYDKKVAYFYDAPWKDEYLRNLEKAVSCYKASLSYWTEALQWAEKANAPGFKFLFMTEMQNWEDERERIKTGELDYGKMLSREIGRVEKVKADFLAMESKNY